MTYSDEQLSAYLDGELSEDLGMQLALDMKTDSALANRLAGLAAASEAVKQAYKPLIEDDIPAHILSLLDESQSDEVSNVVAFAKKDSPKPAANFSRWATPIAASFALVFGTMVGRMSLANNQTSEGALYAQMSGVIETENPLFDVLEQTPSSQRVSISKGEVSVLPILSFKSVDGQLCREFHAQSSESALRGLACKQRAGWEILMLNKTDVMKESGYRTASGAGDGFMDALIDDIIVGDALDSDAEANAITKNWYAAPQD